MSSDFFRLTLHFHYITPPSGTVFSANVGEAGFSQVPDILTQRRTPLRMANGHLSPAAFEPQSQNKIPIFRADPAFKDASDAKPIDCRLLWQRALRTGPLVIGKY